MQIVIILYKTSTRWRMFSISIEVFEINEYTKLSNFPKELVKC